MPASYGEKVVIRILDSRSTVLSIDGLGLLSDETRRLNELMNLEDVQEGLRAVLEKRKPVWKNK